MHPPIEMLFRGVERTTGLAEEIQDKLNALERDVERIDRCRVLVEGAEDELLNKKNYRVQIQLSVSRREVFVGREFDEHHHYDDPFIAVDDAFEMLRDQLRDHVEDRYTDPEHDAVGLRGVVAKICLPEGPEHPEHGMGTISTCDGREFPFEAQDLVDVDFQRLELGSQVEFEEGPGAGRSRAASIHLVSQPPLSLI